MCFIIVQMAHVCRQVYYHQQGDGRWCGGKDLASSAAYTGVFCRAILRAWLAGREEESQP